MNTTDDGGIPKYWDSVWVANSLGALVPVGDFTKLLYFEIALSGAIIIHSWVINKFKFRALRICTELTAFCTILQSSFYLYCTNMEATDDYSGNACSIRTSAYLFDAIGLGFAATVVQICDNYVVFHRYVRIMDDKSTLHRVLVLIYLLVFLYGTYWPFYTVVAWFINLNTIFNLDLVVTYMAQYILFPAYVFYDIFYTSFVVWKLYQLMHNSVSDSNRKTSFRILVIKTILHNLISIGAIGAYSFYTTYGIIVYDVAITFSLHVCLNWKIENHFRRGSLITRVSSAVTRGGPAYSQAANIYRKVSSVNVASVAVQPQ